jgi:hypothetical protein
MSVSVMKVTPTLMYEVIFSIFKKNGRIIPFFSPEIFETTGEEKDMTKTQESSVVSEEVLHFEIK